MHTPIAELYESGYHSVRIIGWGEDISTDSGLPIKYWVNIEIYVYYLGMNETDESRVSFLSVGR